MITCVCGLPGEGKSLYLVWLINQFAQAGRVVATNVDLRPECPAYDKVFKIDTDDYPICEINKCFFTYLPPGCVVVIDEADVYFDASDHAKIVEQCRIYFKQHRKRGDTVVLCCQRPANLWVRIRRLVGEWVWCHRDGPGDQLAMGWWWYLIPKAMWRFRRCSFAGESMREMDQLRSAYFSMGEAEQLYGWYYTEQLIGDTSFLQIPGQS